LGNAYLEAERYQEAMVTLSEFVDLYPAHEYAPEARALLDRLRNQIGSSRFAVGCLLPLTGPSEVFGLQALEGVEFAFSRFQARDGAPFIELVVKDSGSDSVKTVSAVRQLAEAGVVAIIGPIFTAAAAAAESQQLEVPMITITQKDDVAAVGDYIFSNFFTPRMQVRSLVAYAVERLGITRFAVLYPEEKYGQTFMNLFWDEALSHGASVVAAESYNPSHTDFADPIKKLAGPYEKGSQGADGREKKSALRIVDFEALFIPDAPRRAGLVIPQLAYNDLPPVQLLGTNLWHSETLVSMARPYVQGAIMPDVFFAASQNPEVRDFVDEFTRIYGRRPGFVEAVLYDTAMMLFQILGESGSGGRLAVRNRLAGIGGYSGLTGPSTFDESGNAQKSLYMLQIEGGDFIELPR
jgi:ABC-type branched-subunit amino acid transport system substrate-binding protein